MNHRPHEGIVCTESYHVLFSVAFSKDFDINILYSCHKCTVKGENGSLMCTLKGCVTRDQKELFHLSVKELSLPIKDPLEFFQCLLPFSKYTCSKLDGF